MSVPPAMAIVKRFEKPFPPSNEGTVDSVEGDKLTIRFKTVGLKVVLESYVKAG